MKRITCLAVVLFLAVFIFSGPAAAEDTFKIAWSHYTGWEPWEYANHSGILKNWADKYGIEIRTGADKRLYREHQLCTRPAALTAAP